MAVVYALYDYGDLVDVYDDPATAEHDAEQLRKQDATNTSKLSQYFNPHMIKVVEVHIREEARFK